MKYCSSCGAELPNNAHFCRDCGYTLDATQRLTRAINKRPSLAANSEGSDASVADAHITTIDTTEAAHLPVPARTALIEQFTKARAPELKKSHLRSQKATKSQAWGWFPALSLTSAVGVFLVALAYESGRVAAQWADPLFWCGLLVIFMPIGLRLLSIAPSRWERVALLAILGIALYSAKFLQYPLYFANNDEFLHWRTVHDLVASGHLFQANPLLSISTFYPGLEIVASALINLTGLPAFPMGVLIIVVVRLMFALTLYLFYERVSGSARSAGIATLLYMTNSDFLFGNAIFAYESLALPLAVFVVLALALNTGKPAGLRKGLTLATWLAVGAVVITHHLTSYALVAFLFLWAMISFFQRRYQKDWSGLAWTTLLSIVLCVAWLKYTGDIVIGYLTPRLYDTVSQLFQILTNQRTPRQLFHDGSGATNPLWERIISSASIALITLGVAIGAIYIWRRHRFNALALALSVGALAYPISQGLRLVAASGAEVADRTSAFLFLGVAFVLAIGVTEYWLSRSQSWHWTVIFMGGLAIIVVGQVIAGSGPPWIRTPGPYLIVADARSIEPEGITAAEWEAVYLGTGHRVAADHINTVLMATYGDEQVVTQWSASTAVDPIFTSLQPGPDVDAVLQQDRVEYIVVDRRLTTGLPRMGFYFEEPASGVQQNKTLNSTALAKFDSVKNVSRVFDSGDIVIYDVSAISNAPTTTITSSHAKGAG